MFRYKLARFANYSAVMYSSGIAVLDLIQLGRRLVNNRMLDRALEDVSNQIEDGETISNSFASTGLFPPLVVRMVRIGETSGALDKAFSQVGYFYGREARESIERFEQYVMPLMILTVGMILLWVIVSIFFPLFGTAVDIGTTL